MKDTKKLQIANGPKRNELFSSFEATYNGGEPVDFVVMIDGTMAVLKVSLVALEYESGGGESFNLRGYTLPGGYRVSAYYNAATKGGHMELTI